MNVTRIGVMIGSPSDAADERDAIAKTIQRWNAVYGRPQNVLLEPVMWETHSTPGLSGRPQGMINQELIPQSDLLVAVFHARAGSNTGVEVSGTIEEIREFLKTGKLVAVYFYSGPVMIGGIDEEQLKTLRTFQRQLKRQGLVGEYQSIEELKTTLLADLGRLVAQVLPRLGGQPPTPPAGIGSNPTPPDNPPKKLRNAKPAKSAERTRSAVIEDSEDWGYLGNSFIRINQMERPDDRHVQVELTTNNAKDEAALEALRPQAYSRMSPIAFAYGNDAFLVRPEQVKSTHRGNEQTWTVTLVKENIEYGGSGMESSLSTEGKSYSADELAELRARRILLNDPPPVKPGRSLSEFYASGGMLETFIQGLNTPVRVEQSAITILAKDMGLNNPELFLRLARLAAIFQLKAGGVVERIERLALGPLKNGLLHVSFRGIRRKKYSNTPAAIIEFEGDCDLGKAK